MIDNYISRTMDFFDSKAMMVEWTTYMLLSMFDKNDNAHVDVARFKECKAMFKKSHMSKHTNCSEVFVAKMYYSENPQEYMERIDTIHKNFEKKLLSVDWGDDFAALLFESSGKDVSEANEYFKKAGEILNKLQKKQSFWDGVHFGLHDAMLIALSGRDVDYYIEDMVSCVNKFKSYYKEVRDIALALSSPLALSYKTSWKVDDFMKIYNKYINKSIELGGVQTQYTDKKNPEVLDVKYSTSFKNPDSKLNIYTIFAFYIVNNVDFEKSMPEIIEYYSKLRDVDGIGPTGKFLNWGQNVNKEDTLAFATLLVLLDKVEDKESIVLLLIGDMKLEEYIAAMNAVILSSF